MPIIDIPHRLQISRHHKIPSETRLLELGISEMEELDRSSIDDSLHFDPADLAS